MTESASPAGELITGARRQRLGATPGTHAWRTLVNGIIPGSSIPRRRASEPRT